VRRRGGDNRAGWRWRRMGVFELQPPGAVYSRRSVARAAKRIIRVARNRPRTPEGKEAARHHGEEAVSCERTGASGQAGKAGFLQPSGRNAGQRRGRLLAERREPRHQQPPEAWCLHNMPQWPSTAQIAVRAQQRAEAALDTAPRHEDRVSGRWCWCWCWSTTARAILRESRTLEPQLCRDLQPRCCVQLGRVVNRALPLDARR
jgi:hypothetical protein